MAGPFVSLLTDFGSRDVSAAICRSVVLSICPDAVVVDLTHEVRKYAIRDGALALWCALPYLPVGWHVAVVDPGVAPSGGRWRSARPRRRPDRPRQRAARAGRRAAGRHRRGARAAQRGLPAAGGHQHLPRARRSRRQPATAAGADLASVGPLSTPPRSRRRPCRPLARSTAGWRPRSSRRHVRQLQLSALAVDVQAAVGTPVGRRFLVRTADGRSLDMPWVRAFGEREAGESLLYEDSYGRACIAVNQGSAADALALRDGTALELLPR
jgi:hypothetical protein